MKMPKIIADMIPAEDKFFGFDENGRPAIFAKLLDFDDRGRPCLKTVKIVPEDEDEPEEEPAPEAGMLLDMFAGIPTAEVAGYEKSGDYGVAIIDPVAKAGKFIKAFGGFAYGTPECYEAAIWAKKINEACEATDNPARAVVVPLRFASVTTILKKVAERAAPVPGEKNLC